MTFRLEEKVLLENPNNIILKKWLFKNNYKKLFPDRKINSLYFDNKFCDMFNDSEEGCVPRKKIRIRHYPNLDKKYYNLEIKISSIEGRFKTVKKLNNKKYLDYINNGYFDSFYGECMPKVSVEYEREYFGNKYFRITIDSNINYNFVNSNLKTNDRLSVLEFKSSEPNAKFWIIEKIPFPKSRFSKYCRSFHLIYS